MDLETTKIGRGDPCPSPEAIAAYLDGRLADRERDRICLHLTACQACYIIFVAAARAQRPWWWKLWWKLRHPGLWPAMPLEGLDLTWSAEGGPSVAARRLAWSSAGGLSAAALLFLLVWSGVMPFHRTRLSGMQQLIAAASSERPIEPRLSGDFKYAQLPPPLRAGGNTTRRVAPDLKEAAGVLERELSAQRTVETLRAAGVGALLTEDVDRAVELLQDAFGLAPTDPALLSDLSAAYLVRAARDDSRADRTQARAMAEAAISFDPRLLEARFNRALALERLATAEEARAAWQEYLDVDKNDNDSGWAGEARQHLARLR